MYFTDFFFQFSKSAKSALVTYLSLDQSGTQLPHVGSHYLLDNGIQEAFRIFSLLLLFQYILLICLGKGQTVPIFLGTHWASFLATHVYQFWKNSFNYCLHNSSFLPFPMLSPSKISVIQIMYLWPSSSSLFPFLSSAFWEIYFSTLSVALLFFSASTHLILRSSLFPA